MGHILKVQPVLKEKIWGGTKLRDVYGYDIPSDHTGEAWVISGHKSGDCPIVEGEYKGKTVSWMFENHRELFGNVEGDQFPLLVKIIDAKQDLSVQVHPDNEYAKIHENSLGKTESWYVLQADEGTDMVMGDFFYIPAGTLHAICGGSLIYEAQQSSDITYRVYDYHRKGDDGKERELHVQQSIDCTKVPADLDQNKLFVNTKLDHGSKTRYLKCEYLTVDHYLIEGSTEIKNDDPFQLVSVIDGEGTVNDMPIKKGDQFIICSDVDLVHYEGGLELMVTTL